MGLKPILHPLEHKIYNVIVLAIYFELILKAPEWTALIRFIFNYRNI